MGQIYILSNSHNLESDNFHYTLTSYACPEQYDVYEIGTETESYVNIVAYIRLRGGRLTVECPDCNGELVFSHIFEDDPNKGCFDDEVERKEIMSHIDSILCKYYKK